MNNIVINKLIGKGEYGKVFKAKNKFGRVMVIKNSDKNLQTERNITKKLEGFNVPAIYGYRELLFSEFINGETLRNYIRSGKRSNLRTIVREVISNIQKIHKKMSTFRHHDLHLDNIMVLPYGKVKIMDFGLSTMRGIKNPTIKDFKKDYGIFTDSHLMYDAHFFLNSLYAEDVLKPVIESLLPKEYLGSGSEFVKNFRLRSDVDHTETLKNFTYNNIIDAFKPKAPNILTSILSTKKKSPPPKNKTPVAVGSAEAKKKAMAFLAAQKKKKNAPLKKPTLVRSKPVPLTRGPGGSAKKNNGNNKR